MKRNLAKLTMLLTILFSYTSCNYKGYKESYNKNGIVILTSGEQKQYEVFYDKDSSILLRVKNTTDSSNKKRRSFKDVIPFAFTGVDPKYGKEIDTAAAKVKINRYQTAAGTEDSRYIDMYYINMDNYMSAIRYVASDPNNPIDITQLGIRIYFSKEEAAPNRNSVVFGPILNKSKPTDDPQIVEPLWRTNPTGFTAFDFGSLCPDNCTNYSDKTGYDTDHVPKP